MACDKLVFSALYTRKFFVHPDHSKWLLEGFYRRKKTTSSETGSWLHL